MVESEKIYSKQKTDKMHSKQLIGKTVVTKSGKKFGEVGNLSFETRTGELIQLTLKNPTEYAETVNLEKDPTGDLGLPFSSVIAIGDFIVISEEDII